ncbi:uncharacterized protein F4822DRAFT_396588 [Hypoxylon trugodes]|uniref:uncharacterized protein n=1 Tax=Hypoxylon trugodes TaxID=326681 RepID=UPI002199FC34|nr:uncharacterized protein F4822DRAFT_396588 [Hypoxylon trugodes]KAI1391390.1 hypothetical protein F4822DRAFT_396588 [Hypoxylon trugodes]
MVSESIKSRRRSLSKYARLGGDYAHTLRSHIRATKRPPMPGEELTNKQDETAANNAASPSSEKQEQEEQEQQEGTKESRVSWNTGEPEKKQNRWRQVKSRLPDIVNTFKELNTGIGNDEKQERRTSQKTIDNDLSRHSSLSEKGREVARFLVSPTVTSVKQKFRPKQKDPLHQWFVDHSGGTLKEK